jgi:hypothetical protein
MITAAAPGWSGIRDDLNMFAILRHKLQRGSGL